MAFIRNIAFVTIISLLFLQACKEETTVVGSVIVLSQDSLALHIEKQFNQWNSLVCQDQLIYMDTLRNYYKARNYKPLWWDALTGDSASWADLELTFAHSVSHGMDHRYYQLPFVDYHKGAIDSMQSTAKAYRRLAELELILSNHMLRMYEDIANGRSKPRDVYGYTYMLPPNNKKELDFDNFLNEKDKNSIIDNLHNGDTTYNKLRSILTFYLKKKLEARSTAIDFSDYPKIEVGDTVAILPQVIAKLKAKKLPNDDILNVQDTTIYTAELASLIKKLQEKYSLTPDGIMGYKTYKVINASPKDNIDQVKANMERQRWFTRPNEGAYVYINLPVYEVAMHWEDSVKTMRVCIGKNLPDNYDALVKEYTDSGWLYKLPKNMETPQIASKITYMVINPTWTIPYSIIRNEMWWRLVRDPAYLSREGYKVFLGKTEVNGDTIQWSKVNRNRIPYQIVQNPGPKNSLGTVKYMFNNPFSIYLHDTPSKSAFNKTQRAVSHGCVRLQDPILFGEYLTQNSKEYDADDFRIMMGYPPRDPERLKDYDPTDSTAAIQKLEETTIVRLEKPMPLYLDYRTVYYDREWKLHFCYDIYDQNKLILQAMDRL
ncbi:L,D-transpeptidase family protein [Bacteroidia bacterium]|nr:L,D-transpeptidase family protein [Bacteroidia bacterium]